MGTTVVREKFEELYGVPQIGERTKGYEELPPEDELSLFDEASQTLGGLVDPYVQTIGETAGELWADTQTILGDLWQAIKWPLIIVLVLVLLIALIVFMR